VRMIDGKLHRREKLLMMSTGTTHEAQEIGVSDPEPRVVEGLGVGEVGYLITGVKDVRQSKVGDTITAATNGATDRLSGYQDPLPMVFSGLYPIDGSDYPLLRDALDKLQLNDASLTYEPETSVALGFGFRVGYLGLLHVEIVQQAQVAHAESESEGHRGLRLIGQGGVVELEFVQGIAQERIVRAVDRVQPGEHHRQRVLVAAEPVGGAVRRGGDGVPHLGLAYVLHPGDEVANLAHAQALDDARCGARG